MEALNCDIPSLENDTEMFDSSMNLYDIVVKISLANTELRSATPFRLIFFYQNTLCSIDILAFLYS